MNIAIEMASMGTCGRRQVGCVTVDHRNRILSTGFNGTPPGWPHCRGESNSTEEVEPCSGLYEPSGLSERPTQGKICKATHAEVNALSNCSDVWRIHTLYCTVSPCLECVKAILSTGTINLVYLEEYTGSGESKELWLGNSGVYWDRQRDGKKPLMRTWNKYV